MNGTTQMLLKNKHDSPRKNNPKAKTMDNGYSLKIGENLYRFIGQSNLENGVVLLNFRRVRHGRSKHLFSKQRSILRIPKEKLRKSRTNPSMYELIDRNQTRSLINNQFFNNSPSD